MFNLATNYKYLEPPEFDAPIGISCPHPRTCAFIAIIPEIIFLISASVLLSYGIKQGGILMFFGGLFLIGDVIAAVVVYRDRTKGDREAQKNVEKEQRLRQTYPSIDFTGYPNVPGTAIDLDTNHPRQHLHHVHFTPPPNDPMRAGFNFAHNAAERYQNPQDGEVIFVFRSNNDDRYCLRNVRLIICENGNISTIDDWLDAPRNYRQEIIEGRLKAPDSIARLVRSRFPNRQN